MRPLAMALVLLTSCARTPCGHVEPAEDSRRQVGTDVLSFTGQVPKNLLFISIDTLRRDHLGAHGDLGLTPFLDRLADEGVVMQDHMQCSNWTYGAITCTLLGRTNIDNGHLPRLVGKEDTKPPVPDGTPFLASYLSEADYTTAVVSASGFLAEKWGNTQGYQKQDVRGGNLVELTEAGLDLLRPQLRKDKPWFLHVHAIEPHAQYDPPQRHLDDIGDLEPWPEDLTERVTHYQWRDEYPQLDPEDRGLLEAHLRRLYEGEVRTTDTRLERLFELLESECWLDDTLVVIWNDHGEAFWEHGFQTHAFNLTWEENDGILLFWADNIVPAQFHQTTSAIDLVPTLLDLYGIDLPPEVTGWPIGTAPDDRTVFAEALARTGAVQSAVKHGVKMQYHWGDGSVRVYDRVSDRAETTNVFDPDDPVVLDLWSELRPMVEKMEPLVIGGEPSPTWPAQLP